jgi:beta-lactamase class A
MRILETAVRGVALFVALAPAAGAQTSGLQRLLDAELARFPGRAGIWVKHLTTGDSAGVRADEAFNSASVIKIPVLALAFQMADNGNCRCPNASPLPPPTCAAGRASSAITMSGLQPTLRDVLLQMVITSDNTATDLAIGKVGGVDAVNAWLRANNYGDALKLNMTTGQLFALYGALPQGANRNEKTNTDRGYWLGSMTPRATGRLLEAIQRCNDGSATGTPIAAKASCADMVRMFRGQQSGARRLPHFLNVGVGHKTGDFPPVIANDVGMIYARSGPIVVAFFGSAIEGPYAEAEDRIGRIAQLIVEYFDGAR